MCVAAHDDRVNWPWALVGFIDCCSVPSHLVLRYQWVKCHLMFLDESCEDHVTKPFSAYLSGMCFFSCSSVSEWRWFMLSGLCLALHPCLCLVFLQFGLNQSRCTSPIQVGIWSLCQHCEFCISGKLVRLVTQTVFRSWGFQSGRGVVQIY